VLGAAEAGVFPGAAFYLTLWFPAEYRARIYAWFLISIPASTLVAGPTSSSWSRAPPSAELWMLSK
jgi:MFS transporter, ACS family, tartrate transporter